VRWRRALAALPLAWLAACGSWFGSSSGPKPAELPQLANPREVQLLWSASVGGAERYVFSPALAGDAVFAASREGTVARLEAATGKEQWRTRTDVRLSAGVGASSETVAVATEDGEVVALDAQSGKLKWRARVSSEVLAAPAVAGELVIVRSLDSRIFAFGENDGKRQWVYQRAPASLMVRSPSGITVDRDTAYAGFSGGKLVAIALSNGGVRWEATVSLPKGATELERVTDVVGSPALLGREVCVAAYQGRVACYDASSGRQLWARDISSLTGVSLEARYAYLSDERGAVHALDRTNGRPVWKQDRLTLRQLSLPVAAGSAAVVGDFQGYVHFLARDSGAFLARFAAGGAAIRAAPIALPDGVLVQTQDGRLFALAL
jgi:outer membrane protein assembly factor BamB